MSATPSHPGIYIEGIPSGTRAMTGAATSMSGGAPLDDTTCNDDPDTEAGVYTLEKAELFDLRCFPADAPGGDNREITTLLDRFSDHCGIRCGARGQACFHML